MPTERVSPRYHEMLKFRWDAVRSVRRAVKSGLYKDDITLDTKRETLEHLGQTILDVYSAGRDAEFPGFSLTIDPRVGEMAGGYRRDDASIVINKPSLTTFLHELAHHLQWHRDGVVSEDFARAFSMGMFYRACPKMFQRAVETGKIMFSSRDWFPTGEPTADMPGIPEGA